MATKLIKFLELHYTMTQFLIKRHIRNGSTNQIAGNSLFSSVIILMLYILGSIHPFKPYMDKTIWECALYVG